MAATSNRSTTTDVCMVYDTRTGPEGRGPLSTTHRYVSRSIGPYELFSPGRSRDRAHMGGLHAEFTVVVANRPHWCGGASRCRTRTRDLAHPGTVPRAAIGRLGGRDLEHRHGGGLARGLRGSGRRLAHRHVARCGHAPRGRHRRVAVRRRGQLPGLLGRRRSLAPESSFRAPRDGTETRFRFAVIGDTARAAPCSPTSRTGSSRAAPISRCTRGMSSTRPVRSRTMTRPSSSPWRAGCSAARSSPPWATMTS